MSEHIITKRPDQDKINQIVFDILWELNHSQDAKSWLKGRLDLHMPKLKEALKTKTICKHCGDEK